MAHIRKQIRAHVADMIKGSAFVGDRVDTTRTLPKGRATPPTAHVYTLGEQSQDIDQMGTQQRVVRLKIDCVAKGDDDDLQDDFDDFAVHVEQAFAADPLLGGLANATEYRATDFNSNAEADKPFGVMSITYDVTLLTLNTDPENIL